MRTLTDNEFIRMMAGESVGVSTDNNEGGLDTGNVISDNDFIKRMAGEQSVVTKQTPAPAPKEETQETGGLFRDMLSSSVSKTIPISTPTPTTKEVTEVVQPANDTDEFQWVQGEPEKLSILDRLIKPFLPSWEEKVAKAQVAIEKSERTGLPPSMFENTIIDIVKMGASGSTTGIIGTQKLPTEDIDTVIQNFNTTERLIYKAASLGADLPLMVASSMIGAASGGPAAPITGTGAAFAIPAGIRQVYVDRLQKGEVKNFSDFWGRLTSAVYETLKGEATGIAVGAAAPYGFSAELGALTTVGALMEGHVPTPEDILDNALILAGFHGATKLTNTALSKVEEYGKKLSDIYASSGKLPKDVVKETIEESVGSDIGSVDNKDIQLAQDRIQQMINRQNQLEVARLSKNIPDDVIELDLLRAKNDAAVENSIKAGSSVNWWLADAIKDSKRTKRKQKRKQKSEGTVEPITDEEVISKIAEGVSEPSPVEEVRLKNKQTKEESVDVLREDIPSEIPPAHEDLINSLERYYGRPIDEISDREIDLWFDGKSDINWFDSNERQFELTKDDVVDTIEDLDVISKGTENKDVVSRVGTEEVDPVEESMSNSFKASKEKTFSLAEMYKDRKIDNIETYTAKLINDVNRWFYGDDSVRINDVREQLNNASNNIEKLRQNFDSEYDFTQFSEMIDSASEWASKVQRVGAETKVKRRKRGVSVNKLSMGIDPIDVANTVKNVGKDIADAAVKYYRSFEKDFDKGRITPGKVIKVGKEESFKAIIERRGVLARKMIDLFKDSGYRAIASMYSMAGASGRAQVRFKKLQREVFSNIPRNMKKDLFALIDSLRMEDIGKYKSEKEFNFPEGRGPVEAIKFQESLMYMKGYTEAQISDLMNRAMAYDRHIKSVLKDMYDSGVLGDQEYNDLSSHYWRKLKDLDAFDSSIGDIIGAKKARISESGIEKLSSDRKKTSFEMDAEKLAAEFYNMAFNKIAANEMAKNWLFIGRNSSNNGLIVTRYKKPKLHSKEFKALDKEAKKELSKELRDTKIPKGFVRFEAFEGGPERARKTPFFVHPELAKDMITGSSRDISNRAHRLLGYMFLSNPLRFFATASSPIWVTLKALPIDILSAMTTARTFKNGEYEYIYNKALPIASMQLGKDMILTAKDALFRGKQFDIYAENGGMMPFLVKQYRFDTPGAQVTEGVGKFMDWMTYYPESVELWTRLSIQRRVLSKIARESNRPLEEVMKDKAATKEAAYAARDYMDYNQGGWGAKVVDAILPYTNVGILGTKNFFRMAKDDKARFIILATQLGISSVGFTIANNLINPQGQSGVSVNDRAKNRIIQMPSFMNSEDSDGNEIGFYFKLPLPPGMAMMNAVFDTVVEKYLFETGKINYEPDYDAIFRAIQSNIPYDATAMPPAMAAFNNYRTGKDLFTGRTVVEDPLPWPQSAAETDPYETPQILEDIGSVTGLSPKRLGISLEAAFTNSVYSYIVGGVYEKLFGDTPDDIKRDHMFISLSKIPSVSSILGISYPGQREAGAMSDREAEVKMNREIRVNTVKAYAKHAYWKGSREAEIELEKYLDELDTKESSDDYDAAIKQSQFIKDIAPLKHKKFWLAIKGMSPERRGQEYAIRYRQMDAAGKMQLEEEVDIAALAGGWINEKFWEGNDIEEEAEFERSLFKK